MRYSCPLCDFETKLMVQYRKHINENHPDPNEDESVEIECPVENVKVKNIENNETIEILKLKLEMMELKLQLSNATQGVNKQDKQSLIKNRVIDKPIHSFGGNFFNNDFLSLREIINNNHRNSVVNKGFCSAVIEILAECIDRYGGKKYFPIVCVDKKRGKLLFYMTDTWIEDDTYYKYCHKIICRIGQILCHFDEDDEDDVKWLKNRETWLILVNQSFAWDLETSEVYCEKDLHRRIYNLLSIE